MLAPGGVLVLDTIADSLFARVAVVRIAERLPGGPPPGVHDPALLVDPERLRAALAANGVRLVYLGGLRPSVRGYAAWLTRRTRPGAAAADPLDSGPVPGGGREARAESAHPQAYTTCMITAKVSTVVWRTLP